MQQKRPRRTQQNSHGVINWNVFGCNSWSIWAFSSVAHQSKDWGWGGGQCLRVEIQQKQFNLMCKAKWNISAISQLKLRINKVVSRQPPADHWILIIRGHSVKRSRLGGMWLKLLYFTTFSCLLLISYAFFITVKDTTLKRNFTNFTHNCQIRLSRC